MPADNSSLTGSRYDHGVELRADTAQGIVLELARQAGTVLDVGAAGGIVSSALGAAGCTVWAVEPDPNATEALAATGATVVADTIEAATAPGGQLDPSSNPVRFDAVVFADVLEHVPDPASVLRAIRPLLAPGGWIVISVPNVSHIDVRLSLLSGTFDYADTGLLDRTHLRFFTRKTLDELLDEAGLVVTDVRRTHARPFTTELGLRPEDYDRAMVDELRAEPDAETYQFVVRAVPVSADTIAAAQQRQVAQLLVERDLALQRSVADSDRLAITQSDLRAAQIECELQREVIEGQAVQIERLRVERTPSPITRLVRRIRGR